MTRPDRLRFRPGDLVFARWHGSDEFEIVEEIQSNSRFPHYKCKIWGGRKYDYWIFPQIHLAKTAIELLTKEPNRKQFNLF
jgi:hypothetical protein